jgi:hypothetical protein
MRARLFPAALPVPGPRPAAALLVRRHDHCPGPCAGPGRGGALTRYQNIPLAASEQRDLDSRLSRDSCPDNGPWSDALSRQAMGALDAGRPVSSRRGVCDTWRR